MTISMGFSLADAAGLSKGLVCRGGLIFPRVFGGGCCQKWLFCGFLGWKWGFWGNLRTAARRRRAF